MKMKKAIYIRVITIKKSIFYRLFGNEEKTYRKVLGLKKKKQIYKNITTFIEIILKIYILNYKT